MTASASALPGLAVDRVHLLSEDLEWAPSGLTRVQKLITASLVIGATVPAFFKFGPLVWFVPGVVAPVALRLGNRGARQLARRRLGKYARGEVDVAGLQRETDGEVLHVRGRVRASETFPGLIDDSDTAVYRRVQVALGSLQVIHEAAVDFSLVDDNGQRVAVLAQDARLLSPARRRYRIDGDDERRVLDTILRPHIQRELRTRGIDRYETLATEVLVREGDVIDVVGYKTRIVDRAVEHRLMRDEPYRAALRSGATLPLLIATCADAN